MQGRSVGQRREGRVLRAVDGHGPGKRNVGSHGDYLRGDWGTEAKEVARYVTLDSPDA